MSKKTDSERRPQEEGRAGPFQPTLAGEPPNSGLHATALASFPGAYGPADSDATAAFLAAVGHHPSPLAGPFGEQMWNFPIQDIDDDILFGALRDSWV